MKKIIISLAVVATVIVASYNNTGNKTAKATVVATTTSNDKGDLGTADGD